ncbi:spore germination protein [Niallia endozanthoxylica]|uniref:Spore germination protein n=2 Tax=Niallia endozanthoxylica TaxID=2036016 RepID=A0A5J5I7S7_9BACI|nr:spore germination protein [Niallia endozanthoxylica]
MRDFRKRKTLQDLFNKKTESLPSEINMNTMSSDLSEMEQQLKKLFENCSDFVIRPVYVMDKVKILLIYIDGLIDTNMLDEVFLKPMLFERRPQGLEEVSSLGQVIEQKLIAITQVQNVSKLSELADGILKANIGVVIDGETKAMLAGLPGFEKRSIEEPATEVTIRGPKEGFTESLRTNTTLLRRRIRSTKLKLESFTIGELSKTDVVIAYIEGIATDSLLKEVRLRIERIRLDALMGSEMLEEFIEDVPYSPFPQIQNTERPDILVANLLEGRVGIIVDNTPFVLVVPMTFWSGLQAADDYYERFIYTTFIRFIRFTLFNISLFLPSLYVALSTFHPKLIPTSLLFSVAAAREGVPFPAIIEALMMEFVFEGLREAGVRLPKAIGSAVSIVGALVIGQAAVQAGIVSAPMVIVVATTGIASFSIPRYNFGTSIRVIRFIMLILAGIFGLYGIVLGFIALHIHLVCLRSFGIPYFSPVAPQIPADLKDVIVRLPRWTLNKRPTFLAGKDKIRFPKGQKPK